MMDDVELAILERCVETLEKVSGCMGCLKILDASVQPKDAGSRMNIIELNLFDRGVEALEKISKHLEYLMKWAG